MKMEGISSLYAGERASLLGRELTKGLASLVSPQESRRFPPPTISFNRAIIKRESQPPSKRGGFFIASFSFSQKKSPSLDFSLYKYVILFYAVNIGN
jgi:hypothetical protein